jgi:hypothetical protein
MWALSRHRDKAHYADLRIMPTSGLKSLVVAVPAVTKSA